MTEHEIALLINQQVSRIVEAALYRVKGKHRDPDGIAERTLQAIVDVIRDSQIEPKARRGRIRE